MPTPETFWTRLDQNLGAFTIASLERAAGIGKATLVSAHKRGTNPTLDTVLALSRALGVAPAILLGPDTPAELAGAQSADEALRRIPLDCLVTSALNPRRSIGPDSLGELADSIAEQGLLQNLVVRAHVDGANKFWVVAGERRYRALELLRMQERLSEELLERGIPCRVITATDNEHTILALLENMQRQNVDPLDEAEAMHSLHSLDAKLWSAANIAKRLGVTPRLVQLRLQLITKLVPAAKEKLRTGEINLSQARVMASRPEDEQLDLLDDAMNGCDAAELARVASENMFPAEHALFDVAKSKLETWTDPEGEIFLTDFDAAFKLQEKAVAARKKALQSENYPSVEIRSWFPSHLYTKGAGAVIVLDTHNGHVQEHLGVIPKPDTAPPRDDASFSAAQLRYRQTHEDRAEELLSRIRHELTFTEARAIYLWDEIAASDQKALSPSYAIENDDFKNRCAGLIGLKRAGKRDPNNDLPAFVALLAVKEGAVQNAFVAHIAARIAQLREGVPAPAPIRHLATVLGMIVPDILTDDHAKRLARIKEWAGEAEDAQTDLEDAIADAVL